MIWQHGDSEDPLLLPRSSLTASHIVNSMPGASQVGQCCKLWQPAATRTTDGKPVSAASAAACCTQLFSFTAGKGESHAFNSRPF